jgi:class 3 adenylate cyclase
VVGQFPECSAEPSGDVTLGWAAGVTSVDAERAVSVPVSEPLDPLPLPGDPVLATWSSALNDAGYSAVVVDAAWRIVFATDDMRRSWLASDPSLISPVGWHYLGREMTEMRAGRDGALTLEHQTLWVDHMFPFVVGTQEGNREILRSAVPPELRDRVDAAEARALPPVMTWRADRIKFAGTSGGSVNTQIRLADDAGNVVGVAILSKPAAGMSQLWAATGMADLDHLDRMRQVERADRRPAAILMADLESSSLLARRLSTAQYFAFGRRLVRAIDRCVVEHGGIVGRHVGDGAVAFFLAETAKSESAAAVACIDAGRAIRDALADVAARSGVPADEVSLRFGLHWGATLYVGRIATPGRSEVTALGDEVNEAARIEACATGGRTLASKPLVERLDRSDAQKLGLDPVHTTYTPLADLTTATDKARRDAPAIPVCEI